MTNKYILPRTVIFVLLIALVLVACNNDSDKDEDKSDNNAAPTQNTELTRDQYIVIGDISGDAVETIEETQPFADYLATQLADQGIQEGRVAVAGSIDEMIQLFANGEVDIYFDSAYPAALVLNEQTSHLVILRSRSGISEYTSVLFVKADSGIMTADDLVGHMVAFEDDFSTSGYILPFIYLSNEGHTLTLYDSITDTPATDAIGYAFSDDEDTTLVWVLDGRATAGVLQNDDFEAISDSVRDQLVVIYTSDLWPRQVGIIRDGFDSETETALLEVLRNAHTDPNATEAMDLFGSTTMFDDFPDGLEAMETRLQDLVETVTAE